MVKKIILTVGIITCCLVISRAQDEPTVTKKFDQYISVQVNELLKQIINLNNSNAVISNPYLLNYSIHLNKSGWGIESGIGYNFQTSKDIKTTIPRESSINDLFFRLGFGRRMMVSKRLEIGYALDLKVDYLSDRTLSSQVTVLSQNITDSSISTTTSKTIAYGAGPRFHIGFYVTKSLIFGTEVTYYLNSSKAKLNVDVINYTVDKNNGTTSTTQNSNAETDTTTFNLSFPTALFLIFKF